MDEGKKISSFTYMCSVETWLRPWASWEAKFSSRQPSRQVTSSAILPLYRRLLVVVAGSGEGRGSWFNTVTRRKGRWNSERLKRPNKKKNRQNQTQLLRTKQGAEKVPLLWQIHICLNRMFQLGILTEVNKRKIHNVSETQRSCTHSLLGLQSQQEW